MRFDIHRPPHYYQSNIYFITGRTFNKSDFFSSKQEKNIFFKILKNLTNELGLKLYAWIVWDNHYHFLFLLPSKINLGRFINRLHSVSALQINRLHNTPGCKIWSQYWDHSIRDEVDFWKHFNYIHHNPVKHGWAKGQEEAFQYPFSSCQLWIKRNGVDWMDSCFAKYQIADFTIAE